MSPIAKLEPNLVNMIAAGEVVERPASALKELVENALDSGASAVTVDVRGGGSVVLRVMDNGSGMVADDLVLAVQPHATSKISGIDDLNDISTLGFRGEALSAISSLSDLTIKSRAKGSEVGNEIILHGSWKDERPKPCVMGPGTEVIVNELFKYTPARRKFLRKPQTEWAHCDSEFMNLALSNPDKSFTLMREGNERRSYPPQELKERVNTVMGSNFAKGAASFRHKSGPFDIQGFVDLDGHGARSRQHIYINGRAVKDTLLRQAIRSGLYDVIRHPEFPYVIYLSMPGNLVDVNAHPAKTEVRFKEPSVMFGLVHNAMAKVSSSPVGQNPDIDLSKRPTASGGLKDVIQATVRVGLGGKGAKSNLWPFPPGSMQGRPSLTFEFGGENDKQDASPTDEDGERAPPDSFGRVIGLLHGIYLLTENDDGMIIIDVHAAHERILYEELKKTADGAKQAQQLIEPIELDLSPVAMDAAETHRKTLAGLGLIIKNKEGTEHLCSVPAMIAQKTQDPKSLVSDYIEDLSEVGGTTAAEELQNKVFATLACHAAVRGSNPFLSQDDIGLLLERMVTTLRSGRCNHGRPCWRAIKVRELDYFFERGR